MKKFLLLMLTLICAISFVACGGGDESTEESKKESVKESVSISQSDKESKPTESKPESEPESKPESLPESEPESESLEESEEESESVARVFTITFEVEGAPAPDPIQVTEGEVVELPTEVPGVAIKHWVIKGTNTVFDITTLDSDVTLVAVLYTETDNH